MREAMLLARLSVLEGEVPVGAVVTARAALSAGAATAGKRAKTPLPMRSWKPLPTRVKRWAAGGFGSARSSLRSSPAPMCAGALINARMKRVVFGAYDAKAGSCGSVVDLFALPYNHKPILEGGYMEQECASLLTDFFRRLRESRKSER